MKKINNFIYIRGKKKNQRFLMEEENVSGKYHYNVEEGYTILNINFVA